MMVFLIVLLVLAQIGAAHHHGIHFLDPIFEEDTYKSSDHHASVHHRHCDDHEDHFGLEQEKENHQCEEFCQICIMVKSLALALLEEKSFVFLPNNRLLFAISAVDLVNSKQPLISFYSRAPPSLLL